MPVAAYPAGALEGFDATFYLGSHAGLALPAAFLRDVNATRRTVVWFRHNLPQWLPSGQPQGDLFGARFGFRPDGVRGYNAPPTAARPQPGFFEQVPYKGQTLTKFYAPPTPTTAAAGDPDLVAITLLDTARARTVVPIDNPATGERLPYVVRADTLWYFADLPLTYIGPRDRYLVLCDLLFDILARPARQPARALVRLEDVSAMVNPACTRQLADYLSGRGIPFGIAVIPHFRDPLGITSAGVPVDIPFAQATRLKAALDDMLARGGRIVAHGWTHQHGDGRNPATGLSGDDFEFWDAVAQRPLPEDADPRHPGAADRVARSLAELGTGRYRPFAFEVPHYQATPRGYAAIRQRLGTSWGRLVYYTAEQPELDPARPDRDFAVGQFFPYVIAQDHYGNKVLPETLGHLDYRRGAAGTSATPQPGHAAADLLAHAAALSVVREGVASFFFHPYWLEASTGAPGLADFKAVVEGIEALGYAWADPAAL